MSRQRQVTWKTCQVHTKIINYIYPPEDDTSMIFTLKLICNSQEQKHTPEHT